MHLRRVLGYRVSLMVKEAKSTGQDSANLYAIPMLQMCTFWNGM